MRARFRRQPDGNYRVTFWGRFWGVIPFRYTVTLRVVGRQGDTLFLSGASQLGPLLGIYTYSAHATSTHFHATYEARNDHGVFLLSRD